MPRCLVALGGNVGPVEQTFDKALEILAASDGIAVGRASATHRTPAVGEAAGSDFVNAAVEIETAMNGPALLKRLQSLERQFGRRREVRWGPRPLDLDLIFYGDQIIDRPELQIPHPACWYRRFVLDPLVEIAADFVHPTKRVTVVELRERLLQRPLPVALAGSTLEGRRTLRSRVSSECAEVRCELWGEPGHADEHEPALLFWLGATEASQPSIRDFQQLPLLPRFDASSPPESVEDLIRHALQAALG